MQNDVVIRTALLSVSDKTGIISLAKALHEQDIRLLSTGGTASLLQDAGIPVLEVGSYTGFPEIMGGRVKTLHPKIHAGLLQRPGIDDNILKAHEIAPIDLLVLNLYPFEAVVARTDHTLAEAIENIDIGGPTMLRAAAKNYDAVTVITSPDQYDILLNELKTHQAIRRETRFNFAKTAFSRVAAYDAAIANYLERHETEQTETRFPKTYTRQFKKACDLRYGENPHQQAAFYQDASTKPSASIAFANLIQGKALSFNNIADAECALECVKQFPCTTPTCVIVKHANPCGVATGHTLQASYERAYATDPESAFGGIIACNNTLDAATAKAILAQQFVEVIIAPSIAKEAETVLQTKPNIRVLITGEWSTLHDKTLEMRTVTHGLLVQETDHGVLTTDSIKVVTPITPTIEQLTDLQFAWQVAKFVKSNAIVYVKNGQTLGIGAGQTSRATSAAVAVNKAQQFGHVLSDAVMASDAFFPFRDGIDHAANAGIKAIIQPGGSIRDQEVIDAAIEHQISMVFTAMRHFKH